MKCLQELFPCRRRRQEEQQEPHQSEHSLRFSRTRRRSKQETAAAALSKRFFESVETKDSSILLHDEQDTGCDINLGNLQKKELSSGVQQYGFMSNHKVVNRERKQRGLPLLIRCSILDEMAKGKAQEMAQQGRILQAYQSATMVENVERTTSLQLMHQLVMHGRPNSARQNILDPRFVKFGMGTAKGEDGMVYVSQLFQGSPVPTDSNAQTTPIKNPRSRLLPTLDISIDPALLKKKNKSKTKTKTNNEHRACEKPEIAALLPTRPV